MPESFGKYLLLERIATGGMAEVYLAKSKASSGVSKFVAIKRILPQYSDNPEFIEMFKEEAKIAVNLNHSNVVSIFDFGVENKQFFLVMEFVEGQNLRQILNHMKKENKYFGIDQITYVAKELSAGLDHAHRCLDATTGKPLNITHRDMSPQNVMISFEGEVKIVDFGIAKAETQMESTKAGTIKGKYGYMSPEQAEGQPVDVRTDIFSAGIVLWELLANDRLFTANSEAATLRKIRECNIPSLRRINPSIPAELEKICMKALSKDRNLRYQTASSLHRDLNRFLNVQFPDFSSQDFSVFMKSSFSQMFLENRKNLVEYAKLGFDSEHSPDREQHQDAVPSPAISSNINLQSVQAHVSMPSPLAEPLAQSPMPSPLSLALGEPMLQPPVTAPPSHGPTSRPASGPNSLPSTTQASVPIAPSLGVQLRKTSRDSTSSLQKPGLTMTGTGLSTSGTGYTGPVRRKRTKKKKSGLGSLIPLALVSGGLYFALTMTPIVDKLGLNFRRLSSLQFRLAKKTEQVPAPPMTRPESESSNAVSTTEMASTQSYNFQIRTVPSGALVSIDGKDLKLFSPVQFKDSAGKKIKIGLTYQGVTTVHDETLSQEGQIFTYNLNQPDSMQTSLVDLEIVQGGDQPEIYLNDVLQPERRSGQTFRVPVDQEVRILVVNRSMNLMGQAKVTPKAAQREKVTIVLAPPPKKPASQ